MAIGTRLSRTSRVVRGPKREFISRSYNLLLRTTLRARFSDAQCGFKAMRTECARACCCRTCSDTAWFFDTELLVLAERSGLRIAEVPVDWVDDPDSRVDIRATAHGRPARHRPARPGAGPRRPAAARAARSRSAATRSTVPGVPHRLAGQALRFGGDRRAVSTLAYLLLFLLIRGRARRAGGEPASRC